MKAGWTEVALGEVCEVVGGGTPKTSKTEFWGGEIPWATPKDLSEQEERYVSATARSITAAGLEGSGAQILPVGSVLLSSRAPIGLVAINTVELATNQGFKSLVPVSTSLLPEYLAHWLAANSPYLHSLGSGATFKEISKRTVSNIRIPLPPFEEQRRIARVLDRAARLQNLRETSIGVLNELANSVFDGVHAGPQKEQWPSTAVSDLADVSVGGIRTGPFGSQLLHSEFVDDGIAVLGIDNAVANEFRPGATRFITPEKYEQLRRYTVRPGDVLITIMGTCGRAAVVPPDIGPAINTKHLCCISLDRSKCLPEFLHAYFLRHPEARRYLTSRAKGAIMSGLNMGIIKDLPVRLPPIDVQSDLVERLQRVAAMRRRAAAHERSLDALFASLQHRAFAGEL